MSYIITATIPVDNGVNNPRGVDLLLADPLIRQLSTNSEETVVDMRGDFEIKAEQVRWLCGKLVAAGILEFYIGHSY